MVKAFNRIYAAPTHHRRRPRRDAGAPGLAVIGDDQDAVATVGRLIDSFGFDPLEVTPLSEGWRIQRDTPGYGPRLTLDGLRDALAQARRHRDM